ncbi:MAG: hypothetical protein AAGG02_21235, partial [Cyanobacteria bacterium P01_H01_bin.15]
PDSKDFGLRLPFPAMLPGCCINRNGFTHWSDGLIGTFLRTVIAGPDAITVRSLEIIDVLTNRTK